MFAMNMGEGGCAGSVSVSATVVQDPDGNIDFPVRLFDQRFR